MRTKSISEVAPTDNLFQPRLDEQLANSHPLFILSKKINWGYFSEEFEKGSKKIEPLLDLVL